MHHRVTENTKKNSVLFVSLREEYAPQRHREHKENLRALRAFVVKKVMHHRDTENTKKNSVLFVSSREEYAPQSHRGHKEKE